MTTDTTQPFNQKNDNIMSSIVEQASSKPLSKFASGILVQLIQYGDSFCEMSTSEQMKRVGCATRVTYYKALNELVSNGHITLHKQQGQGTYIVYSHFNDYICNDGIGHGGTGYIDTNKDIDRTFRHYQTSCLRNLNNNNPSELVSEIDRERGSIPDAASILNSDATCIAQCTPSEAKLYTPKTKTIQVSDENYTPPLYTLSLDTVLASNPLEWIKQRHLPIAMLEYARDNEHIRKRFQTILEDEMDVLDAMDGSGDIHASNSPAQYKQAQQTVLVQSAFQLYAPREDGITRRTIHELLKLTGGVGYTLIELLPGALRKYKPERGDFRNWFVGCVRAAMTEVRPPRVFKQQVVEEHVNTSVHAQTEQASQPVQGTRKPWEKQKPKQLPDDVWLAKYRSMTPEQLRGLSAVSLEPLVEDDVACTGDEDKDIRNRAVARATGGVPVDMTPMELASYKRMQERAAKSFNKSVEPEKQTDETVKPLSEHVWKDNYRSTTKDEFMQTSETLKGMSVLTLSPTFLRGEVACTGDYNTDYKAFCADVRSFTDAMQAEFKARMSNPVR